MSATILRFPVRRRRPQKGEMVRRVLERAQARRDARRPGGAG